MVKHVVCQKFIHKEDAIEAAVMLRDLEEQIPGLIKMEVGLNEQETERSYDLVLTASFESMEGLHAYEVHPAHQAVRAFIRPRRSGTVSVDYTV